MNEEHDRINQGNKLDMVPIIAIIISIAVIGTLYISESAASYNEFESEKHGFSFRYPRDWRIATREGFGSFRASIIENTTPGQPRAEVQIYTIPSFSTPLEEAWDQIDMSIENNENIEIIEVKNITMKDAKGVDFSYQSTEKYEDDHIIVRNILLKRENSGYSISSYSFKNTHDQFKSELNEILNSFTLLD